MGAAILGVVGAAVIMVAAIALTSLGIWKKLAIALPFACMAYAIWVLVAGAVR